jgi:hypothetical protein
MRPRVGSRACCGIKVSEDVDLSGLVRHEDIMAAAEAVVNKFDFGTD